MHSLKDFTRNGAEDSKFRRNKPNNCTAVYNHAQHIVNGKFIIFSIINLMRFFCFLYFPVFFFK